MHHCAYSTAKGHASDGGIRDAWAALFDRYQVDLVLSGHNHAYERTHPIRGGQRVASAPSGANVDSSSGTTYLMVGGGGASVGPVFADGRTKVHQRDGSASNETANWSAHTQGEHCFLACTVTPGSGPLAGRLAISARD